ncbi:MAG: hypothetical protein M3P98_03825 [bacterium]|nr:hypothetical protein [bacterium]
MTETKSQIDVEKTVNDILGTIEKEREREIISRRFGLFDRKETLEQIGELLGITRERVRQLEKAAIIRLTALAKENKLPNLDEVQNTFVDLLKQNGSAARVDVISAKLTEKNSKIDQSRVAFITKMCPRLSTIDTNDFFFQSAAITQEYDEKALKAEVEKVVTAIKKIGEPVKVDKVAKQVGNTDNSKVEALASLSKQLATLNGRWGLIKWPMVNPKNIRDKIYVILFEKGKHLHFSEISKAIKASDFKRKNVTTQAIHNELIKDKRFVLVGRGIYALKEWGYSKGTVADVITEVLKKEGTALHRDEIVKRVLKTRYVKETTILLNLQGKQQFKRVAKATYNLAEA